LELTSLNYFFLTILFLTIYSLIYWSNKLESDIGFFFFMTGCLTGYSSRTYRSFILFMLASSYSLFLLSRLAHGYIQRKRIPYNHKIYFSKRYILTFIIIFALNILYILIPIIIWICLTFLLYLFLKAGYISGYVFEILSLWLVTIFIGSLLYVGYRVLFGYIILAGDTQESEVKNARFYVAESIRKTSGKVIWKFIVVFIIYAIIIFPFYMLQSIWERKLSNLSSALWYKTISVDTIPEQDMAYYEYVTLEYSDISSDQIVSRIWIFTWISTIYSITLYFLLSWLFVLIMTSFYTRILNK
jgi:hypothetical protein